MLILNSNYFGNFSNQISEKLKIWTNQPWQIIISKTEIDPDKTLSTQQEQNIKNENTIVKEILESFPGAKVKSVVGID